ncbi:YggS family pyridoxal phosphate-dependent enzyme [Apibacter raozihei]|uniref:YggS family pyridoxal phosphate-dependent enzyme n=1 Tax=Apibacter raozihei TaxID=2500547 RepID=UPI000FE31D41|nr:YggS family pyridoxal phosphate-dependent enzyme [Apibacter raozihei]
MNSNKSLETILKSIPENVKLIAVSKTRSVEEIQAMYDAGQRDFGENKVQELTQKYPVLPKDIHWHQIGHLQKNKVKYIAPFIDLIHSVDSEELLQTINKEAKKNSRVISVLLQIKIAQEETKYGLSFDEALKLLVEKESGKFEHVKIRGCMGMASFTDNINQIKEEFSSLNNFYVSHQKEFDLTILSMGMSDDYPIAIECGSTMVRIGSKLFGPRDYTH